MDRMFAWENTGKKISKQCKTTCLHLPNLWPQTRDFIMVSLAAGLIWSLFITNPEWHRNVAIFFLSCMIIAGIYGAVSVSKRIFFMQVLTAVIALLLVYFLKRKLF